jgi:hypothetical protein
MMLSNSHVGSKNSYAWAGGTFFSSCAIVSVFWFWCEIVFGVTYLLTVQYYCDIVSVFWFRWEIVFGVTYYTYLEYNTDVQLCQFFGCGEKLFYSNLGIGIRSSPPKGTVPKIPTKIPTTGSSRQILQKLSSCQIVKTGFPLKGPVPKIPTKIPTTKCRCR